MDSERAELPHPHSTRWTPYTDRRTGEIVTLSLEQVAAVHHAVRCVDELRRTAESHRGGGAYPPLSDDFYGMKSRALGRLLVDGKPLFEECPPYSFGAADYWPWDKENEQSELDRYKAELRAAGVEIPEHLA